jgi:hypothetical protein
MQKNVVKEDQLEHKLHYQGKIFGHNQTYSSYLKLWVIFKPALVMLIFFETILYLVFDMWHIGRFINQKTKCLSEKQFVVKAPNLRYMEETLSSDHCWHWNYLKGSICYDLFNGSP